MTDEELLKFDLEELELEKEVLEELLHNYSSPQYNYWLEEIERVRKALEGLFLRRDDRTNEREKAKSAK